MLPLPSEGLALVVKLSLFFIRLCTLFHAQRCLLSIQCLPKGGTSRSSLIEFKYLLIISLVLITFGVLVLFTTSPSVSNILHCVHVYVFYVDQSVC